MILDITEYTHLARDDNNHTVAAGAEPAKRNQQIAPLVASQRSEAFGEGVRFLRLHAASSVRIAFGGEDVTADVTCRRLPAGSTEFVGVKPHTFLAVIAD